MHRTVRISEASSAFLSLASMSMASRSDREHSRPAPATPPRACCASCSSAFLSSSTFSCVWFGQHAQGCAWGGQGRLSASAHSSRLAWSSRAAASRGRTDREGDRQERWGP